MTPFVLAATVAIEDRAAAAASAFKAINSARCGQLGVPYPPKELYLRGFKREGELEAWVGDGLHGLKRFKIFRITASSGSPGPKRKEGDGQVPEGFYTISGFNPQSQFLLSMRVSYPNAYDLRQNKKNPGGDIFIHGNSVTIGCIPIGDDGIRQLYTLCGDFRRGRKAPIPVHLFPARLGANSWGQLKRDYSGSPQLLSFWTSVKRAFDLFEATKRIPRIVARSTGYSVLP